PQPSAAGGPRRRDPPACRRNLRCLPRPPGQRLRSVVPGRARSCQVVPPCDQANCTLDCTLAYPAFVAALRCFTLAESFGGVESLIAHSSSMTHGAMSEAARARAGIGPGLLRLSVGIEDGEADVAGALAATAAGRSAEQTACSGARRGRT